MEKSFDGTGPAATSNRDQERERQSLEEVLDAYPDWLTTTADSGSSHRDYAVYCAGPRIAAVGLAIHRLVLEDEGFGEIPPSIRSELIQLLVSAVLNRGLESGKVSPEEFPRLLERARKAQAAAEADAARQLSRC